MVLAEFDAHCLMKGQHGDSDEEQASAVIALDGCGAKAAGSPGSQGAGGRRLSAWPEAVMAG
jgi:hypothetical protein